MENIYLTEEGAKTVLNALENPPPVTDKLRAAAEEYKRPSNDGKDSTDI